MTDAINRNRKIDTAMGKMGQGLGGWCPADRVAIKAWAVALSGDPLPVLAFQNHDGADEETKLFCKDIDDQLLKAGHMLHHPTYGRALLAANSVRVLKEAKITPRAPIQIRSNGALIASL